MNTLASYLNSTKLQLVILHALAIAGVTLLGDLVTSASALSAPSVVETLLGLVVAQGTAALNGWLKQHPIQAHIA